MTRKTVTAALAVALLISACSTAPPDKTAAPEERFEPAVTPSLSPREQVNRWLADAETAGVPVKQQYQLKAVELLLRETQLPLAQELMANIDVSVLPADLRVLYAILEARILRSQGRFQDALNVLNKAALQDMIALSEMHLQLQVSQLRASLYALEGMHLAAAQERIYIDPLLPSGQQGSNHESIWRSLSFVPIKELLASHTNARNRDFLGWLELAAIAKGNQGNIDSQLRQLDAWQQRWPDHPAAANLPGGLASLGEMAAEKPQQIALILPFSGKLAPLGKAIRDGFMATYHQGRGDATTPLIHTYDCADAGSAGRLYRQAVLDGAQLVIGPLRKEAVESLLAEVSDFAVPLLALNRARGEQFPANVYQFALAPQDEARQIADIAASEGHERAVVMTPAGDWGSSVAEAFRTEWRELGGQIIGEARFHPEQNDYSQAIHDLMQLDRSEKRAEKLKWLLGNRIEFQPRRRGDVDFIFMVARPDEAQAIKPLLAFHYAGDVPVYATSHIYDGVQEPDKYRDIDGVKFVGTPWSLTDQAPEKTLILEELPGSALYQRMYALGVDAYRLHPRLRQLAQLDGGLVYGETGNLRLNRAGQIERELLLGIFKNGRAVNIPLTDTMQNPDTPLKQGILLNTSTQSDRDIHEQESTRQTLRPPNNTGGATYRGRGG